MFLQFCLAITILNFLFNNVSATPLEIRAWQSAGTYPTADDYPETALLKGKPSTAIGFTGGGSRAYVAALGQLAALTQLNLIKNVRYIGGISGGSWATLVYSFAQNVKSDTQFLGEITPPHLLTKAHLEIMDPACARSFAAKNLTLIALNAIREKKVSHLAYSWAYAVQNVYLDPVGIPVNTPFSWSAETVKDLRYIFIHMINL